jgi:putative glycosyltransferase
LKLSIVTTLYNSAPHIRIFCDRAATAAQSITDNFEIILVNDGSPDDSLSVALEVARSDPRIVVVDLSRNFGHHKAIWTGLRFARGDRVFLIDSDLEEPPEELGRFTEVMNTQGCDVVYGFQLERKRGIWDRVTGNLYYSIVNSLSEVKLPRNLVTARLMTRRYLRSLLQFGEREFFLSGLWASTGYAQIGVPIQKAHSGRSSYSLSRRSALAIHSMISFSARPLIFSTILGACISGLSFGLIVYVIVLNLLRRPVPGWSSTVASIWLMGGLILFFIGVTGLYIAQIFVEVKRRPLTIIRDVYRAGESSPSIDDAER